MARRSLLQIKADKIDLQIFNLADAITKLAGASGVSPDNKKALRELAGTLRAGRATVRSMMHADDRADTE